MTVISLPSSLPPSPCSPLPPLSAFLPPHHSPLPLPPAHPTHTPHSSPCSQAHGHHVSAIPGPGRPGVSGGARTLEHTRLGMEFSLIRKGQCASQDTRGGCSGQLCPVLLSWSCQRAHPLCLAPETGLQVVQLGGLCSHMRRVPQFSVSPQFAAKVLNHSLLGWLGRGTHRGAPFPSAPTNIRTSWAGAM